MKSNSALSSLILLQAENAELRNKLDEAELTLAAIRSGSVDALVVGGPSGDSVFTLEGADRNYRLLIESISEGVLTTTEEGCILYCNAKFAEMVNRPHELLVGQQLDSFVCQRDQSRFFRLLESRSTHSQKEEVAILSKEGREMAAQISIGKLEVDGTNGLSIILTDLTETKMAADLVEANRELKGVLQELSRSNAELARFAFVASHDLKEPLRVVTSYVQMLQRHRKETDEASTKYMRYIVDAVTRMYGLIDDLLTYSRIGANEQEFTLVNCNQVVREVASNIETSLTECRGEIFYENLPTLKADRGQLIQLFQNLLGNAIKYRSSRPVKVSIAAKLENGDWIFTVQDNGIGIEKEYFEKIFVLFQRLHRRDEHSGTGIGLAVCKKVLDRHGGRIWVESQIDVGSTFYFSIPNSLEKGRESAV